MRPLIPHITFVSQALKYKRGPSPSLELGHTDHGHSFKKSKESSHILARNS